MDLLGKGNRIDFASALGSGGWEWEQKILVLGGMEGDNWICRHVVEN